jgi:uncharacterized protein (TIGR03437 family)
MKKYLTSLALLVLPLSAQYTDLVTTRDGNQLYFSSSLRLRGTAEFDTPKIFRYISAFDLIQQPTTSKEYLVEPEVSADGTVTGYTATFPGGCACGFCISLNPLPESGVIREVQIPRNPLASLIGRLRLARDGKSALICCGELLTRTEPTLVDLESGAKVGLKGLDAIGDGRQAFGDLSDGGEVILLVDQTRSPVLYRAGKTTRLHFTHTPIQARMSADARTIVYEAADAGGRYELIVHHAGTGMEETLQTGPAVPDGYGITVKAPTYFHPWLSDDGSSVLFREPDPATGFQHAFLEFTNGSGFRRLTSSQDVPEGVTAATLSGNGAITYVGTPDGRILRIAIPSGKVEELAGATPQLTATENYAPGSVNWISGAALARDSAQPRVMAGDLEAPVISAQPALVKFQIPWEIPAGRAVEIRLSYGSPPPFESVLAILTSTISANFLTPLASPFGDSSFPPGLAYHQDFSSFVTPSNPAQAGETIHFYMSGLGPVTQPLATGQKTPSSGPLHKAMYPPVFCAVANIMKTGNNYPNVLVRYVGLAPGYVGLYQMDLQVPEGLVNAVEPLSCGFQDLQNGGYQVGATNLYVRVP